MVSETEELKARLEVLQALSLAGRPDRTNEDAYGRAGDVAWVIDGATGLGDVPLMSGDSDAAWLSAALCEALHEGVGKGIGAPDALLLFAAERVTDRFARERRRVPEQRYEIPTAAVLVAAFRPGLVNVAELGDCRLYLTDADGARTCGGLETGRAIERENARTVAAGEGGVRGPEMLALLRRVRNIANTPEGYWIFAPEIGPVMHARRHTLPTRGTVSALLVSDGFDALAADYDAITPEFLVRAAIEEGLPALGERLRRIVQVEDPRCVRFPRFKASDDATALLLRYRD